ncbi:hypothetical protein KDL45_14690 [bacterium]|nr:hypothetical protein [bacterium]
MDSRKPNLDAAIQDFTRRMADAGHGDDSQSSAAKALSDAVAAHGDTPGAAAAMIHSINETVRKTDFDWSGPNPARYPLVVFKKAARRNFEPPKPSYRGSRTATSGVLESPDVYGAMPKGVAGVGDA